MSQKPWIYKYNLCGAVSPRQSKEVAKVEGIQVFRSELLKVMQKVAITREMEEKKDRYNKNRNRDKRFAKRERVRAAWLMLIKTTSK